MQKIKNVIKFILFIIYTICIFFIKNSKLLLIVFIFNIFLALVYKIKPLKIIKSLKVLLPFVTLVAIVNLLLEGLDYALIISIKIVLCYNVTYIFSKTMSVMEIANVIQTLFYPLKLFKIDNKEIGVIVSIAICMIPVFKKEVSELINSMKSKGKELKPSSFLFVVKPFFISMLRRTSQIEKTLIAKGYVE